MTPPSDSDLASVRPRWKHRVLRAARTWWDRERNAVESARPLAVLRIGVSLVLLFQAAALAPSLLDLYGVRGLVQWPIARALVPPGIPRVDWVTRALTPWGLSDAECVRAVFLTYVSGLTCLLFGWRTRMAAVVAWLGHLMLCISGTASVYGVDTFARIALFYCVVTPVGAACSLDCRSGRISSHPTAWAHLGHRALQVHLCIIYAGAGLPKAVSEQWWSGDAIWYALMQPTLAQIDFSWLANWPACAMIAAWATIIIEAGYPLMIWPRCSRTPWVLATIALHLGIAIGMGLASFGALLIVLNLAAFPPGLPLWGRLRLRSPARAESTRFQSEATLSSMSTEDRSGFPESSSLVDLEDHDQSPEVIALRRSDNATVAKVEA